MGALKGASAMNSLGIRNSYLAQQALQQQEQEGGEGGEAGDESELRTKSYWTSLMNPAK